jgi:hypothetical protein
MEVGDDSRRLAGFDTVHIGRIHPGVPTGRAIYIDRSG